MGHCYVHFAFVFTLMSYSWCPQQGTFQYKVYVSLFMFDQQNEGRQSTLLPIDRPRTTFSSMLPIHFFVKLWNNIDEVVRKLKSRNAFKYHVNNYYLNQYKDHVTCTNLRCIECQHNA